MDRKRGEGNGGALFLLSSDGKSGAGDPKDPEHGIPSRPQPPDYWFSISLRKKVLLDVIEKALDTNQYWRQTEDVLNASNMPYGYLVVPLKTSSPFRVPSSGPDRISVSPPKNGVVEVTAAAGALAGRTRLSSRTGRARSSNRRP